MRGNYVEKRRKELNLTRQQLANALGVGVNTVYRWEKNERTPNDKTKIKLAALLDIPVTSLMDAADIDTTSKVFDPAVTVESVSYGVFNRETRIAFEYADGDKKIKVTLPQGTSREEIRGTIDKAICIISGDIKPKSATDDDDLKT